MSNDAEAVVRRSGRGGLTSKEIAKDCRRASQGHDVFSLLGAHPETNPKAATPRRKSGSSEPTWVKAQEKTFTRWINHCLKDTTCRVENFDRDLQDGVYLLRLLQQLSRTKLSRKWYQEPKVHVQKVENMNLAFDLIAAEGISLVSIDSLQIVKGDYKMTLALIYHLIQHYHIGGSKSSQLKWFNTIIPNANIHNFTTDWKDGQSLSNLVNYFAPASVEVSDSSEPLQLVRTAMKVAEEHLNVPQIIDPEDICKDKPDDQSVSTYLAFFNCPGSIGEKALLGWWNKTFARHLTNFTTDWHDASVLCELVDHYVPNSKRNGTVRRSLIVAERRLGVERTFSPEDVANRKVDRLLLMEYVSRFQGLEVQHPYSSEEERIDIAAEEEEVAKAATTKRLSSYRSEDDSIEVAEQDEFVVVEAFSPTPLSSRSRSPIPALVLQDETTVEADMQVNAENEIMVKNVIAAEPPFTPPVAVEPVSIESPVIKPEATIESPTIVVVPAHTLEEPSVEPSELEPVNNGSSEPSASNGSARVESRPVEKAEPRNQPEIDEEEILMQEALEETFQHAFEQKALKRTLININVPPPTVTKTTVIPPPLSRTPTHAEVHSDNVSISISDILDQEVDTDKEEEDFTDTEGKPERCLVTGRGLYKAAVSTVASFSVDCSQAGRAKLRATVVSPRGDHLDLGTESSKDSVYRLSFTPKVAGNHAINLEWGGHHIPGSPFTCEVLDPARCVASGPGLSRNTVGNTASFQVATRGAGNGTISASIRGPTSRPVVLMEVGHDNNTYFYEYDPEEPGTYVIDIKWSGFSIPGSPFQVESEKQQVPMTADNVVVRELPTHRVQVNQEVVVIVDASQAREGSLNAVAQGPSAEQACTVEEASGEERAVYAVKFTPKEIGEYTIYIDYGECAIPDSPLPITVNDPTKCMVDTTSLPEGLQRTGQSVSLRVLTSLAGEGDLTAVVKGLDQPCQTKQESDGVWLVSYVPQNRGKYFIDLFFDGFAILKTPISFDVGDIIDQIILTKPVNRAGYYPTNKPLEFMILAPGINAGELTIVAHGTKTASTPTLTMSSSNETYTVLFTTPVPDDYKVEITYKARHVSGSPFVLTVRDQPAPEKVVMFDPVIPHIQGKPIELVFDTSQAGEGNLAVSVTSDAGETVATQLKEVSPSLVLITFVPAKEGVYSAGVTWAGKHINRSPLQLKFEVQKKEPPVCVVFESNMSIKNKLTGKVTSKSSGAAVDLDIRQFAQGMYQLSFQPPKKDTYLLQVYESEREVNGSPFTVDLLKPNQQGDPTVEEGKGILGVTVTGEKTGSVKPTLEYNQLTDTAKIGFLSKKRDLYKLNIFWNHKLVRGSPFNIDLSRI